MLRSRKTFAGVAIAVVAGVVIVGSIAAATGIGDDGNEQAITGDAYDKATQAALAYLGDDAGLLGEGWNRDER